MTFFWPFVTLITAEIRFWLAHRNQHHRIRYMSCVTLVTCQMLNRVSQMSGENHQFYNISGCAKTGWIFLKKKFCNEILTLFGNFLRLNKTKIRKKCKNRYTLIERISKLAIMQKTTPPFLSHKQLYQSRIIMYR